jgi:hypothetical protein
MLRSVTNAHDLRNTSPEIHLPTIDFSPPDIDEIPIELLYL